MANKIQITTQLNLDDSQFKSGVKGVETLLKKLSTSNSFVKLKLNDGDFRKQYQSIVKSAIADIRKAFGAKVGSPITYKNAKGTATTIDTIGSMSTAYKYALGQSVNNKLSSQDQNLWKKRSDSLAIYLNILKQIGLETKNVARAEKEMMDMPYRLSRARNSAAVAAEKRRAYASEFSDEKRQKRDDELYRRRYNAFAAEQIKWEKEQANRIAKLQNEADKRSQKARSEYDRQIKAGTDTRTPDLNILRNYYRQLEIESKKAARVAEKAERDKIAAAKKAERERIAADRRAAKAAEKAERERVAATKKAERERVQAAKQTERERIKSENAMRRITREYQRQHGILGGLTSRLRTYVSIYTVASFGRKIAETTGYFEKQLVALEGIVGSASDAQQILSQIKGFALQSPFQTKDLVTFTKQLSAFSIPTDQLFDTTKKLADISAGLGVEMSRIILAYGQVKAASVLRGQELRQFTEAGIPLVEKLREKFEQLRGEVVTNADVFDMISKRQVSFEMVASVLSDMTAEGGRFYKMQENITDTLYGQMQKLKDLWTIEMDNIGKSGGSFLMNIVKLLQLIVKNVKGVSAGLLIAFTLDWAVRNVRKLRMEWDFMDAQQRRTLARNNIKTYGDFKKFRLAQFGKNLAWGAAAAGAGIAIGALINYLSKLKEVENKMNEISSSFDKETNKMVGGFDDLVVRLRMAKKGTQEYNDALETLRNNYGQFLDVNDKTISVLLNEQEALDGTIDKYKELRDNVASAIELQQKFNLLKSQKDTLGDILADKSAGSNFWGTGYSGINERYRNLIGNLVGGTDTKDGSKIVNSLFGTKYTGVVSKELQKDLDELAKEVINHFTTSIHIPDGFNSLSDEEKQQFLRDSFVNMYKGSFSNKFLNNTLELYQDQRLQNLSTNIANEIFNEMSDSGDAWSQFIDAANQLSGSGTDLLAVMIRINKEFDKYNPGENEGDNLINKQIWANKQYIGFLKNIVSQELSKLGGDAILLSKLNDELKKEYSESSITDIINAINDFYKSINDPERRSIVKLAIDRFTKGIEELTSQEQSIASKMLKDSTWNGIGRGVVNGIDLQEFIDSYNPYTAGDRTVIQTREELIKLRGELQNELKTYPEGSVEFKDDIALRNAKLAIVDRLLKRDLYAATEEETKSSGGRNSGGWRRLFTDLFGWIKEAREEEKKLVEHSAGFTSVLGEQIATLKDTAVNAFWSEGSPFASIINKMKEYGLETEVFNEDFLKNALGGIITKTIEETGTIDYKDVSNQLLQILSDRIKELESDPKMKSTVDMLKSYLSQMSIEMAKFFGRADVDKLIEDQLKELRKLNTSFDAIKSNQDRFNKISAASSFFQAQQVIYGDEPYSTMYGSSNTRSQLLKLLGMPVGKGLSTTDAGFAAFSLLLRNGSMDIDNISELENIRQQLNEYINTLRENDLGKYEELKGVSDQFDQLLKQLIEDIIAEFEQLMKLKDPLTGSLNSIHTELQKLIDANDRIKKGEQDRTIDSETAKKMRVNATQTFYSSVFKQIAEGSIPSYIKELYADESSSTGISKLGMSLGNWLGENDFVANVSSHKLTQLLSTSKKEGWSNDKLKEELDKLTKDLHKFALEVKLATAIIKKVDQYIQGTTNMLDSVFNLIEAGNRIYQNEDGLYEKGVDLTIVKETVNTISDFSTGLGKAVTDFMSGNYFEAIVGLISSLANLFANLFGIGDAAIQKQQDKIVLSNKALQRSLDNLRHEIRNAAGGDKFDNLTEQIKNLRDQQENTKELERLERNKKSGDADKANSLVDEYNNLGKEVENIVLNIRDEILGVADEIASTLTDSLVEAFRNGENAARSWRDTVRGYIGDVLKEALLTNVIAPKIQSILESFGIKEGETNSDDILQLMGDPANATKFRNELFAVGDWAVDWYNSLAPAIQEMIAWNGSTSELSGGIQGITEDTARTLEGLSYSMLSQLVLIQRGVQSIESSGFAQIQTSWFNDMLNQQRAIRVATEGMNSAIAEMRNGIRPLQVKMT